MNISLKSLHLLILLSLPLSAATWKVFFYMDSSDTLSDMAIKNITDMMRGKPNDKVEFLIQLHAYFDAGLRYKIDAHGLQFIEETTISGDSKQDFIDAARWAFTNNTTDHSMLILSNHGWGTLDPQWDEETQQWQAETPALCEVCTLKRSHVQKWKELHKRHKGFMFNKVSHTYLNNYDLIESLDYIKNTIVNGKLIDIIAFDTCMGDMFEIAYQLAPYTRYLVGNQSCSLIDGFNYQGIMPVLNEGLEPHAVAAGMVAAFDAYYKKNDNSGIYTHAALDLAEIKQVSIALDTFINSLLKIPHIAPLLVQAMEQTPRFCMWPDYTDLVAFCKCVQQQLATLPPSPALDTAFNNLQNFYDTMPSLVVARCGGFTTQDCAHGVAIYMPSSTIDSSYYHVLFAHESSWIKLLKTIVNNRMIVIE